MKGTRDWFKVILFFVFILESTAWGQCVVVDSQQGRVRDLQDPFFQLMRLVPRCPSDVLALRGQVKEEGGTFITTMVANQGFHHPDRGSFSFFEAVEMKAPKHLSRPIRPHELLFGHFVAPGEDATLILDQDPSSSSLMVELLAWDAKKEVYNFYELIGSPETGSRWFYRGDSRDIWTDTEKVHRTRQPGESIFGRRLRCSGCHLAGGPLMKELEAPHDSWWNKERPLPFGGREPDAQMQAVMATLHPPSALQGLVVKGLEQLIAGRAFAKKQDASPQIALRPLFCPEEINLVASEKPLQDSNVVTIPTSFFLDERIFTSDKLQVNRGLYLEALLSFQSRFGEYEGIGADADHGWAAPVKGKADILAIDQLVKRGKISSEFITAVLSVDWTRPVFSKMRCELLPLVPSAWSEHWLVEFKEALAQSKLSGAPILLAHMESPVQPPLREFFTNCKQTLQTSTGVHGLVQYLGQVRKEVSASEISKNPRGQILEPGFRVIFPTFTPDPIPWALTLGEDCFF